MAGFQSGDDDDVMGDINITPFVDVMLVLLIVFILTSNAISMVHEVEIPTASNAETAAQSDPISISFNKGELQGDFHGTLTLFSKLTGSKGLLITSKKVLTQRLTEEVAANQTQETKALQKTRLMISASGDFAYQEVVDIIDVARGAGISAVSLNTRTRASDLE